MQGLGPETVVALLEMAEPPPPVVAPTTLRVVAVVDPWYPTPAARPRARLIVPPSRVLCLWRALSRPGIRYK